MSNILDKLNPEQKRPVIDTEGAVLVIAGAGSGKTRVLTSRIAYLVQEKGVSPANIMAITFTNKAAKEMKERLSKVIEDIDKMWVSTIHSMCVKILRTDIKRLNAIYGTNYNVNFSIYDDSDREKVIKRVISEYKTGEDDLLKKIKFHISNAKNHGEDPDQYEKSNIEMRGIGQICKFYAEYEKILKASNALDFDDLLVKTYDLLKNDQEVREYYSSRFKYIHVDEFQDTNRVQFSIINLLASYHHNLFVVGDDDQSIYGWRGAEIENILDFSKKFEGAKTYKLERNYRSTKKILELANAIIANNKMRNDKKLWTENDIGARVDTFIALEENDEAQYTAIEIRKIKEKFNLNYSDFAVLMRVNATTRAFEQEFTKYGIPYKVYGGFKFFERKEIKDLLAYLKLINNPLDDESLLRIINVPKRGIGDKTLELLKDYAYRLGFSLFDAICELDMIDLPSGAKKKLELFKDLLTSLIVDKEVMSLPDFIAHLVEKTAYKTLFEADTEENLNKKMNIDEFHNSVIEFVKANEGATLSDYLNSVTLSSDIDNINEDDNVSIATVHAVKGLEFRCVFVSGLEESIFPISRATMDETELEEERRLMYVAITRAREKLYFTRARSRFLYGERQYMTESRFLKELRPILSPSSQSVPEKKIITTTGRSIYGDVNDFGESNKNGSGFSTSYAKNFIKQTNQPTKTSNNFSEYRTGVKVMHVKFGEGTVIMVKGSGNNIVVDVAFKGIGVKSLSAQFAPMKVIK